MKKGILMILFFALAMACFAIPVVATNTGPPDVVLSVDYQENIAIARERPFSGVIAFEAADNSASITVTSFYKLLSEFVAKYRLKYAEKITLAALISCTLLALVSYLSSARYDVFDMRDRKQPLPMDQTVALSA